MLWSQLRSFLLRRRFFGFLAVRAICSVFLLVVVFLLHRMSPSSHVLIGCSRCEGSPIGDTKFCCVPNCHLVSPPSTSAMYYKGLNNENGLAMIQETNI